MKRFSIHVIIILFLFISSSLAFGKSVDLSYKMKPGQTWICNRLNQTEFTVMDKKEIQRTRHTIEYTVAKGSKKGWVKLSARYLKPKNHSESETPSMGLYEMTFLADMHQSGEVRNITVEGVDDTSSAQSQDANTQAAFGMGRQMIANAHKIAVFWFPELTEDPMEPGDEFEFKQKHSSGNQMMNMNMQSRQVFELEEVNQGLAYFTMKEKTKTDNSGMGGKIEGKIAGKGETVFDLESGMWVEMVIKRKMKMSGAGMMGMAGDQVMNMIEKIEMELK